MEEQTGDSEQEVKIGAAERRFDRSSEVPVGGAVARGTVRCLTFFVLVRGAGGWIDEVSSNRRRPGMINCGVIQ